MKKNHFQIFAFLLFLTSITTYGQVNDSIYSKKGVIFVSGKSYNKQVYLNAGSNTEQITQFKTWEVIDKVLLSFDENYLLIYHKTDKDPSHKLSILDLSSLKILRTIKPGFGGRFYWTHSNNILHIWGCGSPCSCFRLYNLELTVMAEDCETYYKEFISNDLLVSLPFLTIQGGSFRIWSLSDGKLIKDLSFKSKYGEYHSSNAIMNGDVLEVELRNPETDSVAVEKIVIKNK